MSEELTPAGNVLVGLALQCNADSVRWFGDTGTDKNIAYMALCLAGEVGEFCNIVKKVERKSLSYHDAATRYALASELTDVFVYLLNLAGLLHVNLDVTYRMVRAKNEKRFMLEREEREGA